MKFRELRDTYHLLYDINTFMCIPTGILSLVYICKYRILPILPIGLATCVLYFMFYFIRYKFRLIPILVCELVFLALFAAVFGVNAYRYPRSGFCTTCKWNFLLFLIIGNAYQLLWCIGSTGWLLRIILKNHKYGLHNEYYFLKVVKDIEAPPPDPASQAHSKREAQINAEEENSDIPPAYPASQTHPEIQTQTNLGEVNSDIPRHDSVHTSNPISNH